MTRPPELDIALVLSGGNALGAYQAGVYQALHEADLRPDWVAGASIGAINGALIVGNAPDERLDRLAAFWQPGPSAAVPGPSLWEESRRTNAALKTMAAGRHGIFAPRSIYGPYWNPFGSGEPASLYDTAPLSRTLLELADFDLLNQGPLRYCATAIDLESGEDVAFDTRTHRVTEQHVRASAALLPAFPTVEVGGRLLGDAGISANLPLDAVLSAEDRRPLLCIAVDLLPLAGPRPETLGEVAVRMQDLLFATQSRRTLAAWQAVLDARADAGAGRAVTLIYIAYADHSHEVSGKAFDFSPTSARMRWDAGQADAAAALAAIDLSQIADAPPGLQVLHANAGKGGLVAVQHALAPVPG